MTERQPQEQPIVQDQGNQGAQAENNPILLNGMFNPNHGVLNHQIIDDAEVGQLPREGEANLSENILTTRKYDGILFEALYDAAEQTLHSTFLSLRHQFIDESMLGQKKAKIDNPDNILTMKKFDSIFSDAHFDDKDFYEQ